jgi:thioredoxin-dependent peroxiredoxin
MPAVMRRGRRFELARIVLLLALSVTALGLAAWSALHLGTEEDAATTAGPSSDPTANLSASLQEVLSHPDVIPSHNHPLLGRHAPDFSLADVDGKTWDLKELRTGGPVVLIFFYGYHCSHCATQLFDVNRDLPLFREVGAQVVALSGAAPELARRRFPRHGFPVLSDPGNKVARAYQVHRPAPDRRTAALLLHGTFVIDRNGTVRWVNVGDAPFRRNAALLYQLARLEGRLALGERGQSWPR